MENIGANIKRLRKERGLTQRALADKCGISAQAISNYESGANDATMENIFKIAAVLKCRLAELKPSLAEFDNNKETEHMSNIVREYPLTYPTDSTLLEVNEHWDDLSSEDRYRIVKIVMDNKRGKKQ